MSKWFAAGTDERNSAKLDVLLTKLSTLGLRGLERSVLNVERRLQDFDERVGDQREFAPVRHVVQVLFHDLTLRLGRATPDSPPKPRTVAKFEHQLSDIAEALAASSTASEFTRARRNLALARLERQRERSREKEIAHDAATLAEGRGDDPGEGAPQDEPGRSNAVAPPGDAAPNADSSRDPAEAEQPAGTQDEQPGGTVLRPPLPAPARPSPRYHDFARTRHGYPSEVAVILAGIILLGVNAISLGMPTIRQAGAIVAAVAFYAGVKRLWDRAHIRRTWRYRATIEFAELYRDAVRSYLLRTGAM